MIGIDENPLFVDVRDCDPLILLTPLHSPSLMCLWMMKKYEKKRKKRKRKKKKKKKKRTVMVMRMRKKKKMKRGKEIGIHVFQKEEEEEEEEKRREVSQLNPSGYPDIGHADWPSFSFL